MVHRVSPSQSRCRPIHLALLPGPDPASADPGCRLLRRDISRKNVYLRSWHHHWSQCTESLANKSEALLILAALDTVRHLSDIVNTVIAIANTAYSHQP